MAMLSRFSARACNAMRLASQEACRFGDDFIGPEHILLGLIDVHGIAGNVLQELDIGRMAVRSAIEHLGRRRENAIRSSRRLALSFAATHVVEQAIEEARRLRHNYIGSEHLLLGLLNTERDTIALRVLTTLGADLDAARAETVRLLGNSRLEASPPMPLGWQWPDETRGLFGSIGQLLRSRCA
jgi:ATP-dependent Clp protease ATP-binding subunit ClpC